MSRRIVVSPHADVRLDLADDWLAARAPGEEVLVVAASADAVAERVRTTGARAGAAFGWHRATLGRLAASLAASRLTREDSVPIGSLATQAVVARVLHDLAEAGALGRFADAGAGPGLARSVSAVLAELRVAEIDPAALAAQAPELLAIVGAFDETLAQRGLADRARVFANAVAAVESGEPHPWLGLPTLFVDVPLDHAIEASLVTALAKRSPALVATVPAGDTRSRRALERALDVRAETPDPAASRDDSLRALQRHLFEETAPLAHDPDPSVSVMSAPGESRECVEIARRIHALARVGVPFDRIAILLRSPDAYRPHVLESLRRAGVPAHFARGTVLPDPSGRAFLALLACAGEGLSARRFSEYLSLGEVPRLTAEGAPPAADAPSERWVPPDDELVPERLAAELGASPAVEIEPVTNDGSLRVPRRWERLLVEAAVIGGRDRWERRLAGLARELELDVQALDDSDAPEAERLRRDAENLRHLCDYALPLIAELEALPERAPWAAWLEALAALATRALRGPERVLATLAELHPMDAVGPVSLHEVRLVLSPRLVELAEPPAASRYGKVFVAPTDAARGLDFDAVFVPGLAEKLFPRKIEEEPILLDAARVRLAGGLTTNEDRVEGERLALRLAVGAARREVVLSYPRLDVEGSRPRVPSFYVLEALRAAEGTLPGFADLARRAEQLGESRLGWPAPPRPADAIDEAEHDLALLDTLQGVDPEKNVGTARFLLTANPHLGRALRFRARRWLEAWTPADGLVKPVAAARRAIAAHALDARSYSATALQNYAACPYKFYLYAVLKLSPREVPEAIEELSPLQRGSLVHDVQFELFGALRDAGLLPVRPASLEQAWGHLDRCLAEVAGRYRDDLAPAIERVWTDGVEAVRADLREWLRRASEDDSGFDPWRFELSFGLGSRRLADPNSQSEPVPLACGIALRGSIDLVEHAADGRIRVTDHKTGKERFRSDGVVAGGETLQPVLYALAAERLFPDQQVESGRLYYCTSTGGFADRTVPLDDRARSSAERVATLIGDALREPFLPAAPAEGACRWCDFRPVCGPYEEQRTDRKWKPPLAPLGELRQLP